jgi:hypothetical protein
MVGMVNNTTTITPLEETWTKKKDMDMTYLKMNEVLSTQQEKDLEPTAERIHNDNLLIDNKSS